MRRILPRLGSEPRRVTLGTAIPLAAILALLVDPSIRTMTPADFTTPLPPAQVASAVTLDQPDGLFDPAPLLSAEARSLWSAAPLGSALRLNRAIAAPPVIAQLSAADNQAATVPLSPRFAGTASLPVPRPTALAAGSSPRRLAHRHASQRTKIAALAGQPQDNRSFFEKLFGVQLSPGPALAYAALDNGNLAVAPRPRVDPAPVQNPAPGVAIYDIGAQIVHMPSGERLEAHSGLGEMIDDARFAHMRMRGVTPPGTYDLSEREQPFHGVRAIRLNPIGGSGAVFGRSGLLAHTYMLGSNGASNGCVSFRDYDRFLQAFLRGEVTRLVVVAGGERADLPRLAGKPTGSTKRLARRSRDT